MCAAVQPVTRKVGITMDADELAKRQAAAGRTESLVSNQPPPVLRVSRTVYNQERFDADFGYLPPDRAKTARRKAHEWLRCSRPKLWRRVCDYVPILRWLPAYNWRGDLLTDLTAGLTVGIMHIPQGMAYSVLADLDPVYGLYVSLFATLVYIFFGQSVHASFGTFAVVSLMVADAKNRLCAPADLVPGANATRAVCCSSGTDTKAHALNGTALDDGCEHTMTEVQVVSVICLLVGLCHLLMGLLKMGFVTAYLGEQVVRGFTTGASVYVFTSQVPSLLGIDTPRRSGIAVLFTNWADIIEGIPAANPVTLAVSIGSLLTLAVGKELVNPKVRPKIGVPLPFDLLVIIVGTVLAHYLQLSAEHNVGVIGPIPGGLPAFDPPQLLHVGGELMSDAVGIAVVSFAIAISLERLFAKKHGYFIMPDEELCAMGIMNILISFVCCFPAGSSLSRSMVMSDAGTKSQLANVVVVAAVAVVIFFAGPLLTALPKCILAAIIMVALKGMFKQLGDLCSLWRLSKMDFAVWLVAFAATVCLSVKEGLIVAVLFALGTTILRSQWPPCVTLARLPGTDLYRDEKRYERAVRIDESIARLFRFDSPLIFTNCELFVRRLYELTEVFPFRSPGDGEKPYPDHVILDCSGFNYVDLAGVKTLKEVYDDMNKAGVLLLFTAFKGPARDTLRSCGFYAAIGKRRLFASVHDAVVYAHARSQRKRGKPTAVFAANEDYLPLMDSTLEVDDTETIDEIDVHMSLPQPATNKAPAALRRSTLSTGGTGAVDLYAPDILSDYDHFGASPSPGQLSPVARSVSRALSVPARPSPKSLSQQFDKILGASPLDLNKSLGGAQKRVKLTAEGRMPSHEEHDEASDAEVEQAAGHCAHEHSDTLCACGTGTASLAPSDSDTGNTAAFAV